MEEKDVEFVHKVGMNVKQFEVSPNSRFWTKEDIFQWIKSKDDVILVLEEKNKIIGFIMATVHKPTEKALIENLYIDEKFRGNKLSLKLVNKCLDLLKEKGCSYVFALVKLYNKEVVKLFESFNFNKGYDFSWVEKKL